VVFLPGDLRVYIDSGERTHSGTGRNRQTTNIVKLLNIMDASATRPARAATLGDAMQPAHSSIGPLHRQIADYWCYASVFDEAKDLRPLLRVGEPPNLLLHKQITRANGLDGSRSPGGVGSPS
jgi:hypothetical protein